ncbi:pyruvate,water dikinase [Allocatelliglobosispora scoriae]|uniref:Phosphoenolpyruvate synthase n=1 Tax=Allocatelliglobosispora scoriae TaxID=643052 RepID=A0A841BX35_9ACTN|nr:PEP/pyruvate-binding domain-containing protein [Allocatelliglobosispora scoriae]MBB5873697.1 pyruvate,water dikinase [Allocatelliglobosispora scoriae]
MSIVALIDADEGCGNKAAGLGVLLRAGLPVPDGFVVTDPDADPGSIAAHLDRLGGAAFAVRSSSRAEDSAEASFAGQLETVLGVAALADVLAAVRRCAASTRTPRTRGYREQLGLGDAEASTPVIVQDLVDADRAGVLFTRDPRTGDDAIVINASWGLGESVVSGAVTPDEVVVPRSGPLRVGIGTKRTRLDRGEHGLVRSPVAVADRTRRCLSPADIEHLAGLGRRCEELFGRPQDVEWAARGSRLWIVQSRPITVLPAEPARAGPADPAAVLLTGTASSPGRATGPVRVVCGVDDFPRVRRGDVLVCHTTDPAWTPLFRVAAAVVTESGGVLSHAAIVAREYAIPAVVGAREAASRLRDGEPVTVDGTLGTVEAAPAEREGRSP